MILRLFRYGLLSLTLFTPCFLYAVEFFPSAHEIFIPLRADPRELQYGIKAVAPVGESSIGEAAMGDYFGVSRWNLTPNVPIQFSVGGGIFGRFNIEARTNDLEVADFYANLPLDIRNGRWSGRFMLYHTSSHLGDDYIVRTGVPVVKHAWDILRILNSFEWTPNVRMYGGYSYIFRTLPSDRRNTFQAGLELQTGLKAKHWRYFWATDFQSWERVDWNPMVNTQLGITWTPSELSPRTATFYVEYGTGRMPHGQFYKRSESRWTMGVRLTIA